MSKEIYYFSHDSNAITDTKILSMRADYGLEGYGLYWCIIEMMRNEANYQLKRNKNTYRAIKTLSGTSINIEEYIQKCITDYELFKEADSFFYSASLLHRMQLKDEKSQKAREKAQKRWGKSAIAILQNCPSIQKKEKEIENKENLNIDKVVDFYNSNIGMITSYAYEILDSFRKDGMEEDLIIYAMQIAVQQGKRTIAYMKAIVNNWKQGGIATLKQAQEEKERFEKNYKKKTNNQTYTQRKYEEEFLNQFYSN